MPLSALTDEALRSYLKSLNGHKPAELYQLVMGEVEKPLFKTVMDYTAGNQSQAAEILGINRGTLRKKLKNYKLLGGGTAKKTRLAVPSLACLTNLG